MSAHHHTLSSLPTDIVLRLSPHVAVEYFDNGALILDLRGRTVTELDTQKSWILRSLDGQSTLCQMTNTYAIASALTEEQALDILQANCSELLKLEILLPTHNSWKGFAMDTTRYIVNPDVNLREEDEDGALLYNPDSDRVQLLNSTGLYIWKFCKQERMVSEIITALQADFDDAPVDAITTDVEEFVTLMIDSQFFVALQTS